jgi:hypothetical protein
MLFTATKTTHRQIAAPTKTGRFKQWISNNGQHYENTRIVPGKCQGDCRAAVRLFKSEATRMSSHVEQKGCCQSNKKKFLPVPIFQSTPRICFSTVDQTKGGLIHSARVSRFQFHGRGGSDQRFSSLRVCARKKSYVLSANCQNCNEHTSTGQK